MSAYASVPQILEAGTARRDLTPIELIDRIEEGLPVATLHAVARLVTPDPVGLVHAIVPKATLTRRNRQGRLSPAEGAVVARLAEVWTQALDLWGAPDAAQAFLARPHPMLGDRRPLDLIVQSEIGGEMVRQILGGLEYGSAA